MDIHRQHGTEASTLPSIMVGSESSDRFRHGPLSAPFDKYSSSPATAMSIPGIKPVDNVPPPLPPPPFPFGKPPNTDYKEPPRGSFASFNSGSEPNLFPSFGSSMEDRRSRGSMLRVDRDEGYSSLSSTRSKDSLPRGFGALHSRFQFQASADNYCDSMKNKLNPLRNLDPRQPMSQSQHSDPFGQRLSPESRLPPLSMPVSLPLRTSILEEPERFTQTPLHSAASPRSAPFSLHNRGPRSPGGNSDIDSTIGRRRSVRTNSTSLHDENSVSPRGGSYDTHGAEDLEIAETSSMRRLHLDDHAREYYVAGLKRRASSPLGDDSLLHSMASQSDPRRRELTRGSPTPRLANLPSGGSSLSSAGRSGSFASPFATTNSNGTPFGPRSPAGRSPKGSSPLGPDSGSYSLSRPAHQRTISDNRPVVSPRKVGEPTKVKGSRLQGFILMCECCPKKPKKFQTQEELAAHEAEKQYECSFCGNRFKNKNEAERHQNSLHVRRHSWSCKALTSYSQAFHESTNRPGEADTCGYCGLDFDRTGPVAGGGVVRTATEQDWDERIQHLTADHKFKECNSSKKFYRADHFRQHLKHSHAGSSGKWTNMLENACMMDETPTPK